MSATPGDDRQRCVFCVQRPATTRDHVPPKAIFAEPRTSDLITVPACHECNSGHSEEDEAFAYWLSLYIGMDTPASAELFRQRAVRTGAHNSVLHRRVIENARRTWLASPSGIVYERGVVIPWDSRQHESVLDRMVRGLYFHHLRRTIPAERIVESRFATRLAEPPRQLSWSFGQTGDGHVKYACCRAQEDETQTMWMFSFYERLFAIANTMLRDDAA